MTSRGALFSVRGARAGMASLQRPRGVATVARLDTAHPGDVQALERWLRDHPHAVPREPAGTRTVVFAHATLGKTSVHVPVVTGAADIRAF